MGEQLWRPETECQAPERSVGGRAPGRRGECAAESGTHPTGQTALGGSPKLEHRCPEDTPAAALRFMPGLFMLNPSPHLPSLSPTSPSTLCLTASSQP